MSSVKETFDDINQLDCFGYLPTTSSIKPAHIANGWFRRLLGKYYDPVLLNQTVIHWTQNGEINPSDRLLADNPSVFEPFRPVAKRSEFEDLRSDLKALVSPSGGAVNKGNRLSSYNITCDRHITEDYNDRHVGAFLHQLVSADFGNGPSPVVGLILRILLNPRDEISSVTAPLVLSAKATDVSIGTYKAESVFKKKGKSFASPTLKSLRVGFDNLAAFETSYGGGLDALRRSVAFGVFALLLHMTNREGETAGTAGPAPLLLYFADRQRTTAYQASHATYNRARRSIETLYADKLTDWLVLRVGQRPTPKKLDQLIKDLDFGRDSDAQRERLRKSFKSFSSQLSALPAMAEALREAIFRSASGTPLDFYRQLGVKSGFVRPAGNNAVRKFYTLEGVLLEAVLASILPDGQMTFREFLDQLYSRYGLLTGGRPEDARVLLQHGIGNATVQDLRANSHVFRQQLVSLGWARQFADGVLVVKVPEALQ
ncbi:MAG: hypothetical protein ABMA15_01390 [Vicinamibacterales bacterium]